MSATAQNADKKFGEKVESQKQQGKGSYYGRLGNFETNKWGN